MKPSLDGLKSAEPKGETMVVPKHEMLQRTSQGPFLCANCEYFNADAHKCKNKFIAEKYGPDVEPGDCCDLFEKKD